MLAPDWMEQVVLYRVTDSKSLASLAYMIPDLPDGQARSQRCRTKFEASLAPEDAGGIAHIIYRYPNLYDAFWLRQRVAQREGSLGVRAFQALTRLDPSQSLEVLEELPLDELYMTRYWTLLPLLMKEPDGVQERFLAMLRASPDPFPLLDTFQGFEDELSEAHIDVALNALEQRLVEASDLSKLDYGDLWRPLDRICSAHSSAALACLSSRRETPLEQKLTEWMLTRSARQGLWADHLGALGVDILYRIGGAGFTQVVNAWLRSELYYGVIDGLKLAFKRPDNTTLQLLRGLAFQIPSGDDKRVLHYSAMTALAHICAWKTLVEALLIHGMDVSIDVVQAGVGSAPLEDEVIAPAVQALSQQDAQLLTGAIVAIGMAQRQDFEPQLTDVLESSQAGSEVEAAAIMALSILEPKEERTLRLITARQKQAKLTTEYVKVALTNNRSDVSHHLLQQRLEEAWNTNVAIALLNRGVATDEMLQRLDKHLHSILTGHPITLVQELARFTQNIENVEHKRALFTQEVATVLSEMAFAPDGTMRTGGFKETIIRALSVSDPKTAYAATAKALKDARLADKDCYPSLLIEIDTNRAIEDLFEAMQGERKAEVRAAIGRALRSQDVWAQLNSWAEDANTSKRIAACRIAQYQKPTEATYTLLQARLNDPEVEVSEAAVTALLAVRQAQRQTDLLCAWFDEEDTAEQWLLLDVALQVGDLGDAHTFLRAPLSEVYRNSSSLVQEYIREAIEERRKTIAKELKTKDSRE